MKILQFFIIYEISVVFCNFTNVTNTTSSFNSTLVPNTTVPINGTTFASSSSPDNASTSSLASTSTKFDTRRYTVVPDPITFAASINDWNLTKILTKKGVDLRSQAKSIRISTHLDGDFESLIRDSSLWIDKSLLLKKIWHDLANYTVIVATAPPRWGKSINLSMFKFFAALPIDSKGNETTREVSSSYQYFVEGKVTQADGSTIVELDEPPLISGYTEHLAKYPVIYISGKELRMDDFLESLRKTVHKTYQRHSSLFHKLTQIHQEANSTADKNATSKHIAEFLSYFELEKISKLREDEVTRGINILTKLLFEAYRRKVVLVMDDYDYFVHEAYFTPNTTSGCPNYYDSTKGIDFTWGKFLCSTFKSNPHLEKALVTGVLRANDPDTLQTYNNTYNAFAFDKDHHLFPFYGVVQPEYQRMVDKRGVNMILADKGTQWYGGYATCSHPHIQMYSPYSVARFITSLQVPKDDASSVNCSSSLIEDLVERLIRKPEFDPSLVTFLKRFDQGTNSIATIYPIRLNQVLVKGHEMLCELDRDQNRYNRRNEDYVFYALLNAGYLSVHYQHDGWRFIYIRIPNREAGRRFRAAVGSYNESRRYR